MEKQVKKESEMKDAVFDGTQVLKSRLQDIKKRLLSFKHNDEYFVKKTKFNTVFLLDIYGLLVGTTSVVLKEGDETLNVYRVNALKYIGSIKSEYSKDKKNTMNIAFDRIYDLLKSIQSQYDYQSMTVYENPDLQLSISNFNEEIAVLYELEGGSYFNSIDLKMKPSISISDLEKKNDVIVNMINYITSTKIERVNNIFNELKNLLQNREITNKDVLDELNEINNIYFRIISSIKDDSSKDAETLGMESITSINSQLISLTDRSLDSLETDRSKILSSSRALNELLNNGIANNELVTLTAISGGGKSLALNRLSMDACNPRINQYDRSMGKPVVLFITNELTVEQTYARLYQGILGDGLKNDERVQYILKKLIESERGVHDGVKSSYTDCTTKAEKRMFAEYSSRAMKINNMFIRLKIDFNDVMGTQYYNMYFNKGFEIPEVIRESIGYENKFRDDVNLYGIDHSDKNNEDIINIDTNTPLLDRAEMVIRYLPHEKCHTENIEAIVKKLNSSGWNVISVVLDYLGRMNLPYKTKDMNSYEKFGVITDALKSFAINYSIPVQTAHQANRGGTDMVNNGKQLRQSSIAESAKITHNSDYVLSITNDIAKGYMVNSSIKNRNTTKEFAYSLFEVNNRKINLFQLKRDQYNTKLTSELLSRTSASTLDQIDRLRLELSMDGFSGSLEEEIIIDPLLQHMMDQYIGSNFETLCEVKPNTHKYEFEYQSIAGIKKFTHTSNSWVNI